jgi:hypothetical protein
LDWRRLVQGRGGRAFRLNGVFRRTLKALRDLRRQVPGVVVQNVGQQQMNVAAAGG